MLQFATGEHFEGAYLRGKRKGFGVLLANNNEYKGEWNNDKPNGYGKYKFTDDSLYTGKI